MLKDRVCRHRVKASWSSTWQRTGAAIRRAEIEDVAKLVARPANDGLTRARDSMPDATTVALASAVAAETARRFTRVLTALAAIVRSTLAAFSTFADGAAAR